jgi:hypothetical protein
MAVERKVRGIERNVSFYETREPAKRGTHERSQTATPKHAVMNEETVGVLLGRQTDRGLAEVHGCGEPVDVTGIADLQTIHRLGRVSDFLGDTEVVIEETGQTVEAHSRHRSHSIETVTRLSTSECFITQDVTTT